MLYQHGRVVNRAPLAGMSLACTSRLQPPHGFDRNAGALLAYLYFDDDLVAFLGSHSKSIRRQRVIAFLKSLAT